MSRAAASLAAVALALAVVACGGDGAEPGASREATLVLDFTPNAVHAGIYAALEEGYFADAGLDLDVREPGASTDAPKLLQAGQAEFAVMDFHDLTLAIERGAEIGGVAPVVWTPLASVIAGDRDEIRRPRDLEGRTVGVTGLPSDDAVLDAVVAADGGDPEAVRRVTIGFNAVAALSAGRVDAVTAFWNAEGVALRELGVSTREFRVDDFDAPRLPELWLATSTAPGAVNRELRDAARRALRRGTEFVADRPGAALEHLLASVDGLDAESQERQLDALLEAGAFTPRYPIALGEAIAWDARHGLLREPIEAREFRAG